MNVLNGVKLEVVHLVDHAKNRKTKIALFQSKKSGLVFVSVNSMENGRYTPSRRNVANTLRV